MHKFAIHPIRRRSSTAPFILRHAFCGSLFGALDTSRRFLSRIVKSKVVTP